MAHRNTLLSGLLLLLGAALLATASARRERIILNTDPGIDDAAAILLALASPELLIEGLTINFGNNLNVTLLAENALRVLHVANRTDIPVFAGMGMPLVDPLGHNEGVLWHGENGMGGVELALPSGRAVQRLNAVEYIIETCERYQNDITIVSIGPLSNIAAALRIEPRLVQWVRRVVIMGGSAFVPGNVSPVAEANIYNDAVAAHLVFTAGWKLWMAGLDVTMQTRMYPDYVESLLALGNNAGRVIYETTQFYQEAYRRSGLDHIPVHDASAIVAMVRPDLYRAVEAHVDVETAGVLTKGQTVTDTSLSGASSPNTYVLREVDADGVLEFFRTRVAQLP